MMLVKEMHIEVNQSLQKIAANKTRKLLPEEVDWLLNKTQERYIKSKVKKKADGSGGFEIDQHDADAIRTLLRSRIPVDAFLEQKKRFAAVLPGDYSYLIDDASVLKTKCEGVITTEVQAKNLLVIQIRKSTAVSGPYYVNVTVTINSNVEFNITTHTQNNDAAFTGYNSAEQIYEVIDTIIRGLAEKGWEVYWERYGEKFFPKSLIVVSAAAITGNISIDSVVSNGNVTVISRIVADVDGEELRDSNNALTSSAIIASRLGVAFFDTSPDEPISELAGNFLYVYTDETFIVSKVLLSYVRKPRRISLILGQDCELAPEFHQTICDQTVEYIKAMIGDPNWEVKLRDNMQRNPNP